MLWKVIPQTLIHFDSPVDELSLHRFAWPSIALSSSQWEFLLTLAEFLQVICYSQRQDILTAQFSVTPHVLAAVLCAPAKKQVEERETMKGRLSLCIYPSSQPKTIKFKLVQTVWKRWAIPTEEKNRLLNPLLSDHKETNGLKNNKSPQYFNNGSKYAALQCVL